jgi:drug/metabolite transporter (DMT)-like permease
MDGAVGLLALAGVVLVARPAVIFSDHADSPLADSPLGVTVALVAPMFAGGGMVTVRKLSALDVPAAACINALYTLGLLLSTIVLLAGPGWVTPASSIEWAMLAGVGICGFSGQVICTRLFEPSFLKPTSLRTLTTRLLSIIAFGLNVPDPLPSLISSMSYGPFCWTLP